MLSLVGANHKIEDEAHAIHYGGANIVRDPRYTSKSRPSLVEALSKEWPHVNFGGALHYTKVNAKFGGR